MKKTLLAGLKFVIICIILFGGVYPLVVTGIGQLFFSDKANGSLVKQNDEVVGSMLIGQSFTNPIYFQGRPMEVSHLSPYSQEHENQVNLRTQEQLEQNPSQAEVPIDLVTASASGVDPNISLESAIFQIDRIASARNMDANDVEKIVTENVEKDFLSNREFVNVLSLNMQLDNMNSSEN